MRPTGSKRRRLQRKRAKMRNNQEVRIQATSTTGWMDITVHPIITKEETMRTETEIQRDYLSGRLSNIAGTKYRQARIKHGVQDEDPPTTAEDLTDRIKSGRFTFQKNWQEYYADPLHAIRWRDPSVKEDYDGLYETNEAIEKEWTAAKDLVVIAPIADALKAVQEWEAAD